jgi:hypothetical protein
LLTLRRLNSPELRDVGHAATTVSQRADEHERRARSSGPWGEWLLDAALDGLVELAARLSGTASAEINVVASEEVRFCATARAALRAGVDGRLRAHRRFDARDAPQRWRRGAAATVRAVRDRSRVQPRVDAYLPPRPYAIWLVFATALTWTLWERN